jgi:ribosomal protein S18 acetylase RimI-like enzyme
MSRIDTVQWGADRLRVGPWRGDPSLAYISPAPGHPPSDETVDECLRSLIGQGYVGVLTAALSPAEQRVFREHHFSVHEHLHLLRHPLRSPVGRPTRTTRRARRGDRTAVLDVDHRAFSPFWRFDQAGLDDARRATPTSRFRVFDDGRVDGYAVTGRAGAISYLQRLAVRPERQRAGIGTSLVVDALHWAQRRGAASMLVNTQERNQTALALYEQLGFVLEPEGLDVLELPLRGAGPIA